MVGELDYLEVLKAVKQLPFNVGKKLLAEFLWGNEGNETVKKHKLSKLSCFGSLGGYKVWDIEAMIDSLIQNNLLNLTSLQYNKFVKVCVLSSLGIAEMQNPALHTKKVSAKYRFRETVITEQDKELFTSFDFFLHPYNDEQKKAITSAAKKILCVAGAGSGKTTTLTKRIEFLIKFRSVDPAKILAITFTRKARQEMHNRLSAAGITVRVETFNSFCEKILQAYNNLAYDKPVRVISFREKMQLMAQALYTAGKTMKEAIEGYYSFEQRRGKIDDELAVSFMKDCFGILDFFKSENRQMQDLKSKTMNSGEKATAELVFGICSFIQQRMIQLGLRDYADQLVDAINLFTRNPALVPKYEHVLVDEYQDINSVQTMLVDILAPENLFCVGDPRQSIYGWRGSKIGYILDFEKKYPDAEVVALTKNYRSTPEIVKLINESIRPLKLPDLESATADKGKINLIKFETEVEEAHAVIDRILNSGVPMHEIFVLGRTNRQLADLSNMMKLRGIPHVRRSEEFDAEAGEGQVTLSTVHAIKGMEAEMVFVIGCTGIYFPCKSSDHPIIDLVKEVDYDKEEEERRLFYVAMSRAKKQLHMSYVGNNPTWFVTQEMKNILKSWKLEAGSLKPQPTSYKPVATAADIELLQRLKDWRKSKAQKTNLPAYIIFHDKVLIEIAAHKPRTLQELSNLKGIGPMKLTQYGEDLLKIIAEYSK